MLRMCLPVVVIALLAPPFAEAQTTTPSTRYPGGKIVHQPGRPGEGSTYTEYDASGTMRGQVTTPPSFSETGTTTFTAYDEQGRMIYEEERETFERSSTTLGPARGEFVTIKWCVYRAGVRECFTILKGPVAEGGYYERTDVRDGKPVENSRTWTVLRFDDQGNWVTKDGARFKMPEPPTVDTGLRDAPPSPRPAAQGDAPKAPAAPTTVSLVVPADVRPGSRVTGSLVTNGDAYRATPGVDVFDLSLSLPFGPGGSPLEHLRVSLAAGRSHRANGPFSVMIPAASRSLDARILVPGSPPLPVTVPIDSGSGPAASSAGTFRVSSVLVAGAPQVSYGPLSGDANVIAVFAGDRPGRVVAASQTSVVWTLPDGLAPGKHQVTLIDGSSRIVWEPIVVTLSMSADKLELMKGETTNFTATIHGPEQLPETAWQSGMWLETVETETIGKKAPGFKLPQKGAPAQILFSIENGSKQTISITPSKNDFVVMSLGRGDFAKGPYTFRGTIKSKMAGGFRVSALVVPFFVPLEVPVQAPPAAK